MKKLKNITCSGLENPLGLDREHVDFSWQLDTDQCNIYQRSYEINVWDEYGHPVWASGPVDSDQCLYVPYGGATLKSRTGYEYQITVTDNDGSVITGRRMTFETGMDVCDWNAKWIGRQIPEDKEAGPDPDGDYGQILVDMMQGRDVHFHPDRKLEPCNVYERRFTIPKERALKKARIYMTALGIYQLVVNGETPDDQLFAPGFTKYEEYLEYQVYDVTGLLYSGENCIRVTLADGWYKGKFGILGLGESYGDELAFLMELELTYDDHTKQHILSDDSFLYTQSPWCYADILIGCRYDARLEQNASMQPETHALAGMKVSKQPEARALAGTNPNQWRPARIVDFPYTPLKAPCTQPVRSIMELAPAAVLTSPKGETIIDFGQNLVGVIRLRVSGPSGIVIKLEHSEVLNKDGTFENFVDGFNRDQTDYYVLKGAYEEVWQPQFTFHGFRYVKISGYPGEVNKEDFTAIVIGSDCRITNEFYTSNAQLNRLQENIMWSQRGNLLSIPTDCPQRKRAGWTGDVWVYGETCCINQDCHTFFIKWLRNLRLEQFDNGLVPIVIPYIRAYEALQLKSFGTHTSAGWGDVIVALPWYLYEIYGDRQALEENFEAMEKWMAYVTREAESGVKIKEGTDGTSGSDVDQEALERQKYLWNTNFHFGDWLYPSCQNENGEADMFASANTTKELVATAIYAHSANLMAKICGVLGKPERSRYYSELNTHIREAFDAEYVSVDGVLEQELQGLYVMALAMDMVPEKKRGKMAERLNTLIKENGNCLDTGFMSIKFLMDVLMDTGHENTAKALLYQNKCPSWLYEVEKGATTIWETWNSIREDDTRGRFSYNHYAFGCIGDWMYRNLLGIRRLEPGFSKVLIAPNFDLGLEYAQGKFDSVYGTIEVKWRKRPDLRPELFVKIPANVTAYIKLPGEVVREIGNGSYTFS